MSVGIGEFLRNYQGIGRRIGGRVKGWFLGFDDLLDGLLLSLYLQSYSTVLQNTVQYCSVR